MGHTKLDEIITKLTALQEKSSTLIDKQNGTIEVFINSLKDLQVGLQNSDTKVENSLRKTQIFLPVSNQWQRIVNISNLHGALVRFPWRTACYRKNFEKFSPNLQHFKKVRCSGEETK